MSAWINFVLVEELCEILGPCRRGSVLTVWQAALTDVWSVQISALINLPVREADLKGPKPYGTALTRLQCWWNSVGWRIIAVTEERLHPSWRLGCLSCLSTLTSASPSPCLSRPPSLHLNLSVSQSFFLSLSSFLSLSLSGQTRICTSCSIFKFLPASQTSFGELETTITSVLMSVISLKYCTLKRLSGVNLLFESG